MLTEADAKLNLAIELARDQLPIGIGLYDMLGDYIFSDKDGNRCVALIETTSGFRWTYLVNIEGENEITIGPRIIRESVVFPAKIAEAKGEKHA